MQTFTGRNSQKTSVIQSHCQRMGALLLLDRPIQDTARLMEMCASIVLPEGWVQQGESIKGIITRPRTSRNRSIVVDGTIVAVGVPSNWSGNRSGQPESMASTAALESNRWTTAW